MEKLKTYIKEHGLTQAKFAESVGLGASDVSRLTSGKMMPSLQTAVVIEAETCGIVAPRDWIST